MTPPKFLKLSDVFDCTPNPPGTYRRISTDDPHHKTAAQRRQNKARRKQGAKQRCKR